jgi:hypothetical protein
VNKPGLQSPTEFYMQRILVVEDDTYISGMLCELLSLHAPEMLEGRPELEQARKLGRNL